MELLWVEKEPVLNHPLYLWEKGKHLPWYRRGRVPLWFEFPFACVCGVTCLGLWFGRIPGARDWILFFGGALPVGLSIIRTERLNGRFLQLRRSGFLRELYLAGRNPLETYAAFANGNAEPWTNALYVPGFLVSILLVADWTALVVFVVLCVIFFLLTRKSTRPPPGHLKIRLRTAAVHLLSSSPWQLLWRETPSLIMTGGLLAMWMGGWSGLFFYVVFGFPLLERLQGKDFKRFKKMNLEEIEAILVDISTGESVAATGGNPAQNTATASSV